MENTEEKNDKFLRFNEGKIRYRFIDFAIWEYTSKSLGLNYKMDIDSIIALANKGINISWRPIRV